MAVKSTVQPLSVRMTACSGRYCVLSAGFSALSLLPTVDVCSAVQPERSSAARQLLLQSRSVSAVQPVRSRAESAFSLQIRMRSALCPPRSSAVRRFPLHAQ